MLVKIILDEAICIKKNDWSWLANRGELVVELPNRNINVQDCDATKVLIEI
jgi:hypothetical protein